MSDERDPPKLSLVSSRPAHEIDQPQTKEDSLREIKGRTRLLLANMLRVARGAGRPSDLFDQVVDLHFSIEHCPPGTTEGEISAAMAAALDGSLLTDNSASPDEDG